MTNTRDAETQRDDDSFVEFWRTNKVALTLAGIGAAAVVAGIVKYGYAALETRAGGDEPPIRVKGGSIHFEVLSTSSHWAKNPWGIWKTSNGSRKKDALDIIISVGPGATVTPPLDRTGTTLQMYYCADSSCSQQFMVEIDSAFDFPVGRKTQINPNGVTFTPDGQWLNSPDDSDSTKPGYVSRIVLDGQTICSFKNKDEFRELVILDY
jgi:hypothetical protein